VPIVRAYYASGKREIVTGRRNIQGITKTIAAISAQVQSNKISIGCISIPQSS
jgi:hypothetical protein